MTETPRIACLMVPLFPLAARLRSEPELTSEAIVVLEGGGARARVVAATRLARRAGIRPGLTLPQARARLPNLIARNRDASCEDAAQEALLDIAEGLSPRVEDAGEGVAYLDVGGLDRHYPGNDPEGDLARTLMRKVDTQAGLPVRVGLAGSKLAARTAAQSGSPTIIVPGDEATFLAPLPLNRLNPAAQILATLEHWGIRSVGALADLPKDEVSSRLGPEGRALHALARGLDPQPLVPRQPPPAFREGMELEWPLVNLEPFVFVARSALERLTTRMAAHGLGCTRLELDLTLDPDGHHERAITLPAPTRDIKTLLTLLHLDLEKQPPGAPVRALTLTAYPDQPRQAQLTLFGPAALSPDKLAATVARLFALLGEGRVGAPHATNSHRPEDFALVPYAPPPPPATRRPSATGRGLLTVRALRPPIGLEVVGGVTSVPTTDDLGTFSEIAERRPPYDVATPEATPQSISTIVTDDTSKRTRIDGAVRVASGPWMLEDAWWSDTPTDRAYWDVEVSDGGLYRIYRDRCTGMWFADGIYD